MQLRLGSRILDLHEPKVMGVLNMTPDSFSDGGRIRSLDDALRRAVSMHVAGAVIIDVGGESTRPGAAPVPEQQEIDRVVPVIDAICSRLDVAVSVDTGKAAVMEAAVAAGATMINDVYALRQDGALAMAAGLNAAVCLMHMQGSPSTMQLNPQYGNVAADVVEFLESRVSTCHAAGLDLEQLAIDPGFGFGKNDSHNLELLHNLQELSRLGLPILVGLSRKRLLGNLTGKPVDQRLIPGIAAAVLATERGARIIRTHDVAETVDALRITHAVMKVG
jgi:dihydropteroate synthase